VNGATEQWSATNGAGLSACNGAATCYAFTDESGQVETRVSIGAVGATTIAAVLAPASYSPPKTVQVSINGTSSAKDLALFSPKVWVTQGATLDIPFTARLLGNGVPQSAQTLNWNIGIGSGTLSPAAVATDSAGYARSTLHVNRLAADVQGTVCVAPGNAPCQTFYVMQVLPSAPQAATCIGQLPDNPRWANLSADLDPRHQLRHAAESCDGCAGFFSEHDLPARRGRTCRDLRRRRQLAARDESAAGIFAGHTSYG
jgi:hypothetical protein